MDTSPAASTASAAFAQEEHDHDRCVGSALAAADDVCARRGERLTPLRRRVLELVWASHRPIGAYALLDQLRGDGKAAAPTTVYRALDFLLEQGLIHRIESLNAFIGCDAPLDPHRGHFLICRGCGLAAEIEDEETGASIRRSAGALGFAVERAVVEVVGLCPRCAGQAG